MIHGYSIQQTRSYFFPEFTYYHRTVPDPSDVHHKLLVDGCNVTCNYYKFSTCK